MVALTDAPEGAVSVSSADVKLDRLVVQRNHDELGTARAGELSSKYTEATGCRSGARAAAEASASLSG